MATTSACVTMMIGGVIIGVASTVMITMPHVTTTIPPRGMGTAEGMDEDMCASESLFASDTRCESGVAGTITTIVGVVGTVVIITVVTSITTNSIDDTDRCGATTYVFQKHAWWPFLLSA
ncbi:MAG TPA: hypothetical protein VFV22_00310 [Candidatus Paceibacterota bacterium]|nr:hypothetical protein [Candidatus Paceibacterota bacterium]